MEATFVLLGTPEPLSRPMAFLMRTAAGGVFVIKAERTVSIHCDDHRDQITDVF